jgi:predicted nucleic acid-binding protein
MLRVVLDSSVLVSSFLTEGGATAMLLRRYWQKAFALCSSPWIVEETERALLRPRNVNRYRYRAEDVRQFLDGLARSAHVFPDAPEVPAPGIRATTR